VVLIAKTTCTVSLFSFHAAENRPLSTKAESANRFIDDFYYLVYIILIAFFVLGLSLLAPVPQCCQKPALSLFALYLSFLGQEGSFG
jgi:hypothetical protein